MLYDFVSWYNIFYNLEMGTFSLQSYQDFVVITNGWL